MENGKREVRTRADIINIKQYIRKSSRTASEIDFFGSLIVKVDRFYRTLLQKSASP